MRTNPPPEVVVSPVGLQPLAKMQVQEQTNCIRFRPDAFVIGTSAYRHINLVGFTTALIGGYPKTSKHITRTLQTYRWFSYIFLNKSMVIFRFKYSRRWSSMPFCTLIQGVGTWLLWLGERVLKVSPKMDGGYGGPSLCSRCGGFSWSYWPKCWEAQMGGSLAPTALGYSIECSFLRQKQKRLRTQMPPGRPPTVPKKSWSVHSWQLLEIVGRPSLPSLFYPKNDTHLD